MIDSSRKNGNFNDENKSNEALTEMEANMVLKTLVIYGFRPCQRFIEASPAELDPGIYAKLDPNTSPGNQGYFDLTMLEVMESRPKICRLLCSSFDWVKPIGGELCHKLNPDGIDPNSTTLFLFVRHSEIETYLTLTGKHLPLPCDTREGIKGVEIPFPKKP